MEKTTEEILLEELGSPKKSVRVSAIVKAAKLTRDPKVVAVLQEMAAGGDKEISLFAKNAVSRILLSQGKKGQEEAGPIGEITVAQLLKPRSENVPGILKKFREDPALIAEDLRPPMAEFLSKHGSAQDTDILLKWMTDFSGNLVVPFLEAIAAVDTEKFLSIISEHLASPHPYVRSRAVGLLLKNDPEEALGHLSELLASDNSEERLAGLQVAFLFPYKDVSTLIITLLSEEKEAEIIQAAAVLLLSNPEIETAYKLLELRESLAEAQSGLINRLLTQLCRTLVSVGLLEEAAADPEILLQKLQQERLEKYLSDLEIQISLGDSTRLPGIEIWLNKNRGNPKVAAFIEKLASNPAFEDFCKRLIRPTEQKPAPVAPAKDIREASPEEKCAFLKCPPGEMTHEISTWIRREASTGGDIVRAAALKALATLFPSEGDAAIAVENIDHANPIVATRAISLLEKIDSKKLITHLPTLLKSKDPFISARAVQLSLRYYEAEALKAVSGMLKSPQPATRAQGINCLMLCPFEKVSPFILEAIPREANTNIAKGLLFILLNNPTPETMKSLDRLPKSQDKSIDLMVAQVRTNLFKLLLQLDMITEQPPPAVAPVSPIVPPPPPVSEPPKQTIPPKDASSLPQMPQVKKETRPSVSPKEPEPQKSAESAKIGVNDRPASKAALPKAEPAQKKAEIEKIKEAPSPAPAAEKAYSVSGVRNVIRQREIAEKTQQGKGKQAGKPPEPSLIEGLGLSPLRLGFAGVLAGCICFYILFSTPVQTSDDPTNSDLKEGTHEVSKTLKMHVLCTLKGQVVSVEPDKTVKFKIGDKIFILEFQGKPPVIVGNEKAEVDIVPYLQIGTGEIFAQCYAFK